MATPTPLTEAQVREALQELPGWRYEADALTKTYVLSNFRAAVSFIVRLAFYAEELNHHPELTNVYNRVTLRLTTHDAGNRVTDRDVKLANAIESFAWV
ncbi:MAG: 4a-hydroxytetrahydrobiopterin dehydratase [Bacteroidetes bacterium]|nr:4a-hydroxytetrahydrobiopterin dehydratase [Rhodothermaceae bacterium RA]RMH51823.1 MAG: 4a-hydroxytetrahydrobiopterin dehydratase [Bacteroidota bacterium]